LPNDAAKKHYTLKNGEEIHPRATDFDPYVSHRSQCCRHSTVTTPKEPKRKQLVEAQALKIAIIGKGNVGTALCNGLTKAGHETKFGHRDPAEPVADAAKWGEVIILSVAFENAPDAIKHVKPYADGKIVIDVMNAVGPNNDLAISCDTSNAEETQKTAQSQSRKGLQHRFR
jgi:hypothetical protein